MTLPAGLPVGSPASWLDTLPQEPPKLTLGYEALRWMIKYLIQPNGPKAGERYQPTPRQALFWLNWYALTPDGHWVYDRGARRLSKGTGKSPGAAAGSLVEFCAPVRLKDWDSSKLGGCVGKPVSMPLVQIAAVAEAQTENTMRMVRAFARKGSRVVGDHGLDPGLKLYHKSDGGKLEVLTSSASTAEGNEATNITGDETEHWLGDPGELFMTTLLDNAQKSGNRFVETCNSWVPGAGSVAERTFNEWVKQQELLQKYGDAAEIDSRILYDARQAAADTNLKDRESVRRALEYVYEDAWWAPVSTYVGRVMSAPEGKLDVVKRKYFNWPTVPESAWVHRQEWQALAADGTNNPVRELVDGERIVLFFDGSKSRDATALVGCCMSDGYVFTVGVWEPKQTTKKATDDDGGTLQADTAQIDAAAVDAKVQATFERFEVIAFWADVREFEGFVKVTWPERWRDQLETKMWAVPGGKLPEPIAWDMRSHSREFALAAELVEAEIRERAFLHDGDSVTERHICNARRVDTRWDAVTIGKETPNSPNKIDAAVCVIGARMLYKVAMANAPEPDEPSEAYFFNRWG
ncbi:hypothetical protein NJBCHELONAE_48590 [Mycobacteroides chelonae]|uniref:terminase n=1 Tax=Mycobacteroides chelonae TaxID=1774 RepID=UPI0021DEB00C|nr:terminase [Mycobacteroides chelonae]GLE59546.1 hypothetical protein NJBCHELONAE_48590 [Mycobacteroides chelonae]